MSERIFLWELFLILDLGCANRPRGDVNLDIDKSSKADIIASIYFLPFQNDSFDATHFHGLLHHLVSPKGAWKEIVRITRRMIIGDEPSNFDLKAHMDSAHVFHGFKRSQLKQICRFEGSINIRYSLVLPLTPILTIIAFKE